MMKQDKIVEKTDDFPGDFLDAINQIGKLECSNKDYEHFLGRCKEITDADLLCKIIVKLLDCLPNKHQENSFIEMLTSLMETLIDLLNSEPYNQAKPRGLGDEALFNILLTLFGMTLLCTKQLFRSDILTKLICNRHVYDEPMTVETIVWGLIRNEEFCKKGLKSNDNFCTLLRQFGKVTAENKRAQLHRCYKMIIQFLVKSYDWVLAKELLP